MFKLSNHQLIQDITCSSIDDLAISYLLNDIEYFDKDGYELTPLEKYFYHISGFWLNSFLYKQFLGFPWLSLDHNNIFIDHSMALMRCDFTGAARQTIEMLRPKNRKLSYLLQIKRKWGFDIDINCYKDDSIFEVLHLEYDTYEYQQALDIKQELETYFLSCDIDDVAEKIWQKRDTWQKLHGYNQNFWKAKYLGFKFSEDTRKSI